MTDGDISLGHAVDTVLRTKELHEVHARGAGQHVGRPLAEAVDAGTVRHQAAAQALEAREAFGREDIDTQHDLAREWRDGSRRDGHGAGVATASTAAGTTRESNGAQRT